MSPLKDVVPPSSLLALNEKQFQAEVVEAGSLMGWLCVHFRNMLTNDEGYPDLTCFRGENESLLIELKTEKGTVSRKQTLWHLRAQAFGKTVHVIRPRDWPLLMTLFRGKGQE